MLATVSHGIAVGGVARGTLFLLRAELIPRLVFLGAFEVYFKFCKVTKNMLWCVGDG